MEPLSLSIDDDILPNLKSFGLQVGVLAYM